MQVCRLSWPVTTLVLASLLGCNSDQNNPPVPVPFGGDIQGAVDGFPLSVAYAGLGNLYFEFGEPLEIIRYGSVVALSNDATLCKPAQPSGTETWMLMLWFQDTMPGNYAVVADVPMAGYRSSVVQAYLPLLHNGEPTLSLRPVSGEVELSAINPSTTDPLTSDSVAEATFSITFLKGSSRVLSCTGSSGEATQCTCAHQDGSEFPCTSTPSTVGTDCCNDGVTETQTIAGSFKAPFCDYLCQCNKGMSGDCPCFQGLGIRP